MHGRTAHIIGATYRIMDISEHQQNDRIESFFVYEQLDGIGSKVPKKNMPSFGLLP